MPNYNLYPEIPMDGAISFIFERKVAINFYFTDPIDENCFAVSTFFETRFIPPGIKTSWRRRGDVSLYVPVT